MSSAWEGVYLNGGNRTYRARACGSGPFGASGTFGTCGTSAGRRQLWVWPYGNGIREPFARQAAPVVVPVGLRVSGSSRWAWPSGLRQRRPSGSLHGHGPRIVAAHVPRASTALVTQATWRSSLPPA